jgi:hypothetical protein
MESPSQRIEKKGLLFVIGKMNEKGYVNIYTGFNPIRKTRLVDMIEDLDCVNQITCIQRHDDESGGIAVLIKEGNDSSNLIDEIKQLLDSIVI